MKIIILSAGTVGATVADTLARHTDNEITVIDRNESAIRNLEQRLDIQTVIGTLVLLKYYAMPERKTQNF